MLNKSDILIDTYLYTSHVFDFVYQRKNGTHYVYQKRSDETYMELIPNITGESRWITGEVIQVIKRNDIL